MTTTPNTSPSQIEIDAYTLLLQQPSQQTGDPHRGAWLLSLGFGLYCAIAVGLSASGFYAAADPNLFAGTVVAVMTALVGSYFFVPSIRVLAERLGPYGLASFHIWRVPAALAFLYYGAMGWLPPLFVNLAGWGDILAGVLAAGLIAFPLTARRVKTFHIIGFADFIVAVGTGLTLQLLHDPLMGNITQLPIALIPLIGVPLSGASHIVAFHLLSAHPPETV